MRSHRLVAALAAALVLGTAGYTLHGSRSAPGGSPTAAPSPGDTAGAPAPGPAGRRRAGAARLYAVAFASSTALGAKRATGGSGVDLRVEGTLALAVAEPSGDRTRVRAQLQHPHLTFGAQGGALEPSRAAAVEADLGRPFYATVEPDGRVVELHVTKGVASLARGVQRSLAATLQLVERPGATWSATEIDTTGEFRAEYRRGADARAVTKTKGAYLRLATVRGLQPPGPGASIAATGTTTFGLDDEGWIRSLVAHDTIDVSPGRGMPEARSTGDATLSLLSSADDASAILAFSRDAATLEPAETADAADGLAAQRQSDELLVAGASYGTLAGAARAKDPAVRAEGQARLAALLRLQPAMAARAATELASATGDDAESLIGALSGAAHPEAQRALATVLENGRAPGETRASAAMALGLMEAPTHETATSLERATRDEDSDVARTSTLAVGTVARAMSASSPEASGAAIDGLLARLESASDPDEIVILLRALGNAGDARVLPLAERAYDRPEPLVRRAAVTSVRLLEGPAADALIARAMTSDADDDVREEALDAASGRAPEAQLPAIASVLAHDRMEKVRLEAVRTLVRFTDRAPEAGRLLRHTSESDPSDDVRQLAMRALGG